MGFSGNSSHLLNQLVSDLKSGVRASDLQNAGGTVFGDEQFDTRVGKVFLMPLGQSTLTTSSYTHVLYVDATVDVRDNFIASSFSAGANADNVYIPNQNGTKFTVVLVRRYGKGTTSDHKRVLLARQAPTWPTNDV